MQAALGRCQLAGSGAPRGRDPGRPAPGTDRPGPTGRRIRPTPHRSLPGGNIRRVHHPHPGRSGHHTALETAYQYRRQEPASAKQRQAPTCKNTVGTTGFEPAAPRPPVAWRIEISRPNGTNCMRMTSGCPDLAHRATGRRRIARTQRPAASRPERGRRLSARLAQEADDQVCRQCHMAGSCVIRPQGPMPAPGRTVNGPWTDRWRHHVRPLSPVSPSRTRWRDIRSLPVPDEEPAAMLCGSTMISHAGQASRGTNCRLPSSSSCSVRCVGTAKRRRWRSAHRNDRPCSPYCCCTRGGR